MLKIRALALCFLLLPSVTLAQPKAIIYRQGSSSIDFKGLVSEGEGRKSWPEGFTSEYLNPSERMTLSKINSSVVPEMSDEVAQSWSRVHFTRWTGLAQGTELDTFKSVVHGLEIAELVNGIINMGFDVFCKETLRMNVPVGIDFVKYYPFMFHKKTVISASVISEKLTATFGKYGSQFPQATFLPLQ